MKGFTKGKGKGKKFIPTKRKKSGLKKSDVTRKKDSQRDPLGLKQKYNLTVIRDCHKCHELKNNTRWVDSDKAICSDCDNRSKQTLGHAETMEEIEEEAKQVLAKLPKSMSKKEKLEKLEEHLYGYYDPDPHNESDLHHLADDLVYGEENEKEFEKMRKEEEDHQKWLKKNGYKDDNEAHDDYLKTHPDEARPKKSLDKKRLTWKEYKKENNLNEFSKKINPDDDVVPENLSNAGRFQ